MGATCFATAMTADAGTLNPATVTEATAVRYFGTQVVG
jgi:hypothetical protein